MDANKVRQTWASMSPEEKDSYANSLSEEQYNQLKSSLSEQQTESKDSGVLKQVKGLVNKSYLFNPALLPLKALGDVIDLPDTIKKIKEDPQKNIPEMLLAFPPVRFAGNAAGSMMAIPQIAENAIRKIAPNLSRKVEDFNESIGLPRSMNEIVDRYEENTRLARAAQGESGFDPVALAGRVADPLGLKVAKMLPFVKGEGLMGLGKNMIRSGTVGAVSAASTPVEQGDQGYFSKLGTRAGVGFAVGSAIPPITGAIGGAGNFLRDMKNAITEKGAKPLAIDALVKKVGKENVPEVVQGLRVDARKLPGDRPSAGDLLVDVPAGSPIVAQQKASFAAEGGASNIAGKYKLAQQKTVERAEQSLEKRLVPVKNKIFERLRERGGVPTEYINIKADTLLKKPKNKGIKEAGIVISDITKQIEKASKNGRIDPEALHEIRIGGVNGAIDRMAQQFGSPRAQIAAKARAYPAVKALRDSIDDSMETFGGTGWKRWLEAYSKQKGKIGEVVNRAKLKPIQPTVVSGDIAKKESAEFANVLWRPVTIANWLHKFGAKQGGGLANRIHKELVEGFINPAQLADDLERAIAGKPSPILDSLGIPTSVIVTNIMKKNKPESEDGN